MNLIEYTRMYDAEERHWWYVGLHELILEIIRQESERLGRALVIFDAGCGTGRLSQLMALQGHQVAGCDASDEALRLCRTRGVEHMAAADLNSLELTPDTYDVITSIDVLYHTGISDDCAVMARLRNGLKPGGMLVLNLVAHEFLRSTHDIAVHTRERYTLRLIAERLQREKFTVVRSTYRVALLFPLVALYRWLARHGTHAVSDVDDVPSDVSMPHPAVNGVLLYVARLENSLLRRCSLPFGSSVFVVARRA